MLPLVADVLVENETGERRLGRRHIGADVADGQRDFVGVPLGRERPLARIVRDLDREHHDHEDQGRNQAQRRSTAATPVEPDVLPVAHHCGNVTPLTFSRKARTVVVPC